MKLGRRGFLLGGASAVAAALATTRTLARPKPAIGEIPVAISATRIASFSVEDPSRKTFGSLLFRSGLVLRSSDPNFGGFSSLWRSPDGGRIVSVADNAQWLSASVETRDGMLDGLGEATLAPLLGETGKPLARTRYYDTESLTISGGEAYVGIERKHAVARFDWSRQGVKARGKLLAFPKAVRDRIADLPHNSGLEAIGVAPRRSPLAGAVIAVSEQARRGEDVPTAGFILTGSQVGVFEVVRSNGYAISDLAFLPDGDMLLLERQASIWEGFRIRLRRVRATAIRPGATIDGAVIFESAPSHQVDNMEGLAVHQDGGDIILTLISDDNFSIFQRTLLLEFALPSASRPPA